MLKRILPIALVAIVASLFLSSCPLISPKTDYVALFKPAELAWPGVEGNIHRGLADGVADGDITQEAADVFRSESDRLGAALTGQDRDTVRTIQWPTIRPWASRGVDDMLEVGEIGPGVASSLRERISKFSDTIIKIQGF